MTKGSSPKIRIAQMGFVQALVNAKISTNKNKNVNVAPPGTFAFAKSSKNIQKIHFIKQKMLWFLESLRRVT